MISQPIPTHKNGPRELHPEPSDRRLGGRDVPGTLPCEVRCEVGLLLAGLNHYRPFTNTGGHNEVSLYRVHERR